MTCITHYCDNQGLCHRCGILMEPDWWAHYIGAPDVAKNKAASDLAKRRWKDTTPEQRAAHAAKMGRARQAAMTPAQRTKLARKGVAARRAKP